MEIDETSENLCIFLLFFSWFNVEWLIIFELNILLFNWFFLAIIISSKWYVTFQYSHSSLLTYPMSFIITRPQNWSQRTCWTKMFWKKVCFSFKVSSWRFWSKFYLCTYVWYEREYATNSECNIYIHTDSESIRST